MSLNHERDHESCKQSSQNQPGLEASDKRKPRTISELLYHVLPTLGDKFKRLCRDNNIDMKRAMPKVTTIFAPSGNEDNPTGEPCGVVVSLSFIKPLEVNGRRKDAPSVAERTVDLGEVYRGYLYKDPVRHTPEEMDLIAKEVEHDPWEAIQRYLDRNP
jgi:hypothetical protein